MLEKNIYSFIAGCKGLNMCTRSGIPKLQDLMPHDLRWSLCDNNRNKVNSKRNALESSSGSMEKYASMKLVPGAKKTGDCCIRSLHCSDFLYPYSFLVCFDQSSLRGLC